MAEGELVFPLRCSVQKYAWGQIGSHSEAASLAASADPEFKVEEDTPYSELWMGTHPNGPSAICTASGIRRSLEDWIKQNPDKLGKEVRTYFKGTLPFLFKVLSVRTALSVQAHPNKVHAEKLHSEQPALYKDDNHKPEMCIALSPFKGLCGFRPIKEVAQFIRRIDELRQVLGKNCISKLISASTSMDMALHREALKDCFTALMNMDSETIKKELSNLVQRLKGLDETGTDTSQYESQVLYKLIEEFPGDVGCFTVYFLNVVTLKPGEAMFLEANLPHAYLSGDCMECMACSDNVVRAGLTPKHRDVETLCKMLNYTGKPANKTKFSPVEEKYDKTCISTFSPKIPDFAVTKYEVSEECSNLQLKKKDSASICIVIKGEGQASSKTLESPMPLKRGTTFFVSAGEEVVIETKSDSFLLFQAYAGL